MSEYLKEDWKPLGVMLIATIIAFFYLQPCLIWLKVREKAKKSEFS